MARLKYLIIHCTDTPENRHVTAEDVITWHTAPHPIGNGWKKAGYTDIIYLDGTLHNITPFDQDDDVEGFEVTNGARGYNSLSRHICYVGGKSLNGEAKDTRTPEQYDSLETYLSYTILRHPQIKIAGHYDFTSKKCPSFDVQKFCEDIGIPKRNIYYGTKNR